MGKAELQRLFEFINGSSAICAMMLATVALCYLVSSWRELGLRFRNIMALPVPMRVAFAIGGMAVSDCMIRGSIWLWRISGSVEFGGALLWAVMIGATIGCASMLLAVREFGRRMFGDIPWFVAVVEVVLFVGVSLLAGR